MVYKKGDEKGYFTRVVAAMALIAILGSIFVYAAAGNNNAIEKEVEVGNQQGTVTADPSGYGPFPTSEPPGRRGQPTQ